MMTPSILRSGDRRYGRRRQYIDVLDVPDIAEAIELATQQLRVGLARAMEATPCDEDGNVIENNATKAKKNKAKPKGPTDSHAIYSALFQPVSKQTQQKIKDIREAKERKSAPASVNNQFSRNLPASAPTPPPPQRAPGRSVTVNANASKLAALRAAEAKTRSIDTANYAHIRKAAPRAVPNSKTLFKLVLSAPGAVITARRSVHGEAGCAPPPSTAPSAKSTKTSAGTPRMATTSGADEVPDMDKRNLLNAILLGTAPMATVAIGVPFAAFFVPAGGGSGSGGVIALDAAGNSVKKTWYLETHNVGSRELVQAMRGDATYLIVTEDKDLEYHALNAVCTHLGCVVPWSKAENKFKCPCHGSQYAPTGSVVRGPAPLPLALERCEQMTQGMSF